MRSPRSERHSAARGRPGARSGGTRGARGPATGLAGLAQSSPASAGLHEGTRWFQAVGKRTISWSHCSQWKRCSSGRLRFSTSGCEGRCSGRVGATSASSRVLLFLDSAICNFPQETSRFPSERGRACTHERRNDCRPRQRPAMSVAGGEFAVPLKDWPSPRNLRRGHAGSGRGERHWLLLWVAGTGVLFAQAVSATIAVIARAGCC